VASGKPNDEIALRAIERIAADEQRGRLLHNHNLECSLDFALWLLLAVIISMGWDKAFLNCLDLGDFF